MPLAMRFDDIGRLTLVGATLLAAWWCWPVGLAILAALVWSRRGQPRRRGLAWGCRPGQNPFDAFWRRFNSAPPSGNAAFDDYREDTMRRLEEEQREFTEYLERLRRARDKAEFDQFMAERRRGNEAGPVSNG